MNQQQQWMQTARVRTFPHAQKTARREAISIDMLAMECTVVDFDEKDLEKAPVEGIYVKVHSREQGTLAALIRHTLSTTLPACS